MPKKTIDLPENVGCGGFAKGPIEDLREEKEWIGLGGTATKF